VPRTFANAAHGPVDGDADLAQQWLDSTAHVSG